jgi:hypothetical protein
VLFLQVEWCSSGPSTRLVRAAMNVRRSLTVNTLRRREAACGVAILAVTTLGTGTAQASSATSTHHQGLKPMMFLCAGRSPTPAVSTTSSQHSARWGIR